MTHWRLKKMNVKKFFETLGYLYGNKKNVKVTYKVEKKCQK